MSALLNLAPNTTAEVTVMYGTIKRTRRSETICWLNKDGYTTTYIRDVSGGEVSIKQIEFEGEFPVAGAVPDVGLRAPGPHPEMVRRVEAGRNLVDRFGNFFGVPHSPSQFDVKTHGTQEEGAPAGQQP